MTVFAPYNAAHDFYAAAGKYTPGSGSAALWNLEPVLPLISSSAWLIANGWRLMANRIATDLNGGLHPEIANVLGEMMKMYAKAAQLGAGLDATFKKLQADDIARKNRRGSHTSNVPVGSR